MNGITYTFLNGDDAEAMRERMAEQIERWGYMSLADVKIMLGMPSKRANQRWGWTSVEGIHHHPTPTGEELVLPPAIDLDELSVEEKNDVKFQHVMPAELAADLDRLASKMGTSRRGLMNVLLYQTIRNQPYN